MLQSNSSSLLEKVYRKSGEMKGMVEVLRTSKNKNKITDSAAPEVI